MTLLVIGVGNDFRGDDAAGLLAARRLHARPGIRTVSRAARESSTPHPSAFARFARCTSSVVFPEP